MKKGKEIEYRVTFKHIENQPVEEWWCETH